jgi:transcription elongation GreA/GreB family factor
MKKNKITPESYSLLQKEVADLEKTRREIAERLGLAGFDSDLSENGDF